MNVPFFDLGRMYILQKNELDAAVAETLSSGHFILGKRLSAFEKALSQSLGSEGEVIGCNSGTDALVLPLLAAGIQQGDEVLVPSHTAIPTITAIRAAGAHPVFVDAHPDTWLFDIDDALSQLTPRTKACVAVHLYGNMVDIDELRAKLDAAGRKDVLIIEDAAQAHGAELKGRQAGTIGDFGAFSFYPTKNIGALGDAGAVYCPAAQRAERVRMLRNYGQRDRYNAEVDHGMNSRLDELQAAILSVRLPKLQEWNQAKLKLVERYRGELSELPVRFQAITRGCVPGWHLAVVRVGSKTLRDRLQEFLASRGVQTLIHYPLPTHSQKAFGAFKTRELPRTEQLAATILSLPMNPCVSAAEQTAVIEAIKEFFRAQS